jgi:GAF domain-containing protein
MNQETTTTHEAIRLADLHSYKILDTPEENDFNELVELAAMICNCPTSLISFVDEDRQWFKAKIELDAQQTSRDISFCSHAIKQDDIFVVENALSDERFKDNDLVTRGIRLRFYAGAPIVSPTGQKLGTICVIDKRPKTLLPKQAEALKMLSRQVSRLLELRIKNEQLTQLLNSRSAQ